MSSDCWLEMGSCWRSRFIHLYPIMLNAISFGMTPLNAINQLACRWTNNLLLIGFEGKIYEFKDIIMSGHRMFFWTWDQTFYNVDVSQKVTKEAYKYIKTVAPCHQSLEKVLKNLQKSRSLEMALDHLAADLQSLVDLGWETMGWPENFSNWSLFGNGFFESMSPNPEFRRFAGLDWIWSNSKVYISLHHMLIGFTSTDPRQCLCFCKTLVREHLEHTPFQPARQIL